MRQQQRMRACREQWRSSLGASGLIVGGQGRRVGWVGSAAWSALPCSALPSFSRSHAALSFSVAAHRVRSRYCQQWPVPGDPRILPSDGALLLCMHEIEHLRLRRRASQSQNSSTLVSRSAASTSDRLGRNQQSLLRK